MATRSERRKQQKKQNSHLESLRQLIRNNHFDRRLLRSFDWPLFLTVLALVTFGLLSIYSATSVPVEGDSTRMLDMLLQQPITYPRLQLIWFVAGMILMCGMIYFNYEWFGSLANLIYWANIALLFLVLFMERGRGNMAGWFGWGEGRTFQPSEVGKIAIIIALAKLFANRTHPIRTVSDLLPVLVYIGLPLLLIALQPDIGTALVYIAIFGIMLFVSGTSYKLLIGLVCIGVLMLVPAWYFMNTAEDSFRLNRILVFLNPDLDPTGAGLNATNSRIAVGSGGLWGKGFFASGSFGSLNYIPEDHTDFIFAITAETFGFVGSALLVALFAFLLFRMVVLARRAQDSFGSYCIIGVMSMMLFHIFENIGMVIGLMPITGIPLPFISYGGSNLLTNMAGIGLVLNIAMRSRAGKRTLKSRTEAAL